MNEPRNLFDQRAYPTYLVNHGNITLHIFIILVSLFRDVWLTVTILIAHVRL